MVDRPVSDHIQAWAICHASLPEQGQTLANTQLPRVPAEWRRRFPSATRLVNRVCWSKAQILPESTRARSRLGLRLPLQQRPARPHAVNRPSCASCSKLCCQALTDSSSRRSSMLRGWRAAKVLLQQAGSQGQAGQLLKLSGPAHKACSCPLPAFSGARSYALSTQTTSSGSPSIASVTRTLLVDTLELVRLARSGNPCCETHALAGGLRLAAPRPASSYGLRALLPAAYEGPVGDALSARLAQLPEERALCMPVSLGSVEEMAQTGWQPWLIHLPAHRCGGLRG